MNRHIINSHSTVIQALRQLNELSGGVMTLVVTDDNDKMLGTLTMATYAGDCSTASPRMTRFRQ